MGDRLTDQEHAHRRGTFRRTTFGLGTRQHGSAGREREAVRHFLAGEPIDLGWLPGRGRSARRAGRPAYRWDLAGLARSRPAKSAALQLSMASERYRDAYSSAA